MKVIRPIQTGDLDALAGLLQQTTYGLTKKIPHPRR